ncbi:MAG: hypothetical protein JWR66_1596 [Modestobacter sp.]|nr:hypothetical protein [Modestobacter sp.]
MPAATYFRDLDRIVILVVFACESRAMYTTSTRSISTALRACGEAETAAWVVTCSDNELVRICAVAERLAQHGPSRRSGSVLLDRAEALAAVYVRNRVPRDTVRARRDLRAGAPEVGAPVLDRRPDHAWRPGCPTSTVSARTSGPAGGAP